MTNDLRSQALAFVDAAATEGRALTDGEAALLDLIASTPDPETVEAPAIVSSVPRTVAASATPPHRVLPGGFVLDAADMDTLLTAARTRQAVTVEAASAEPRAAGTWATHSTAGGPVPVQRRLVDILIGEGATRVGGLSRTVHYPHVQSGDAAIWIPGTEKSEIVTALASQPAVVAAAYTLLPEMARLDIMGLDMILSNLIGRRVVATENGGAANSIYAQATATTGGTTAEDTIAHAITGVYGAGFTPSRVLIAADLYGEVLASGHVGNIGHAEDFTGTIYGVPFSVVGKMTAKTAVAFDATGLAIQPSGLEMAMAITSIQSNEVGLRVETSTTVAVLDGLAAHKSVKA